jgi:carbonic anhydrase/acetyltransferase-like protein (isoleucine patch superfamily)
MTVASVDGKTPRLGAGTWVHPSAEVLGDCCAVEDDCVVHARPGR